MQQQMLQVKDCNSTATTTCDLTLSQNQDRAEIKMASTDGSHGAASRNPTCEVCYWGEHTTKVTSK